jgi:hypothetical protein
MFNNRINEFKQHLIMSILDKATLLVTPNAYKTSKIYSIIPSDGSGDFTFTRASGATIINSTGQYEIVGTNMPRINYDFSGGCPTILLEPQRTNLFRDSEPATTPTPGSGVVASGVTFSANDWGVGLNGKVTFTGNTIQGQYYNSASILAGNSVTLSFIAKKQGGGEVNFGTGSSNDIYVSMQNTAGIGSITKTYLGDNLWYCSATRTSNGASSNYGPIKLTTNTSTPVEVSAIMLVTNGTGTTSASTVTLRPESYVKTTGSSVTKAVEAMVDVISGFTGGAAGGSWYLKLLNNTSQHRVTNGSLYVGSASGSSTSGDVLRVINDGTNTRLKVSKIVNGSPTTLFITSADIISIVFTWNGSTANIYSNGSKVITDTAFTGTTTLNYLVANGTDVPKYIKTMAIFPEPLTDAEAISLTNI